MMKGLASIAAAVAMATASAAHAQHGSGPAWGPGSWSGPWHGWFMGPLMMLVVLGVIAAVVVVAVRGLGRSGSAQPRDDPSGRPLEILRERFARGEIDKAEFDERRRALEE